MDHTDFDKTKYGTPEVFGEIDRVQKDLLDMYWNHKMTYVDIAKQYNIPGVSINNLGNVFKYFNLDRRSFSESSKNAVVNGRLQISSNNELAQR